MRAFIAPSNLPRMHDQEALLADALTRVGAADSTRKVAVNNYEGSHQAYDVVIEHNVMAPMSDGAKLAADIYFPALDGARAAGTFPVILERTPYNKAAAAQVTKGKYFARRGYVCVIQDVRGRFASEGEWYAFAKEADDGYTTVEWLGAQSWSTGKVGTMGGFVRRQRPERVGDAEPAAPVDDDRGGGRLELLPQLDAPQRRSGAAVPDLRLFAWRRPARRPRPTPPSRPRCNRCSWKRCRKWCGSSPSRPAPRAAAAPAVVRALGHGAARPRGLRRLLEGFPRLHAERVLRTNTPTCRRCTGAVGTIPTPATPPKATSVSAPSSNRRSTC